MFKLDEVEELCKEVVDYCRTLDVLVRMPGKLMAWRILRSVHACVAEGFMGRRKQCCCIVFV